MIEAFIIGLLFYILINLKPAQKFSYADVVKWAGEVNQWHDSLDLMIPETFILGIIAQESMGNPKVEGSKGEIGLMQITHPAYVDSGVKFSYDDLWIPEKNIECGCKYLKWIENFLEKNGIPKNELVKATIMSYNIGVANYLNDKNLYIGEKYFKSVLNHRNNIIKGFKELP
ncbi:MAG: transglycosylase SLT domain-containing protein [Promethearchaeota archaeon]